jgi:sulfur relay protein TusB/DsrH
MIENKPIVYLYGFSTLLEEKLINLIKIIENHLKIKGASSFIFLHDGVIGTLQKGKFSSALMRLLELPMNFYALIPDLKARGIDINNLRNKIKGIDYDDLVDILASTPRIVSWI